jgi:hypothetical protein
MPRKLCTICLHPNQEIRDWYDRGESVEFIMQKSGNTVLHSDLEFHSRHSARTVKHDVVGAVDSSDVHETRESRRDELKKKLALFSALLDAELKSPSSPTALKGPAQEFRLLVTQLNQIDSEIEAEKKAEAKVTAVDNGEWILPLNPNLEAAQGVNPTLHHHYKTEGELVSAERGNGRGRTMEIEDYDALIRLNDCLKLVRVRQQIRVGKMLETIPDAIQVPSALANLGNDDPILKDVDPELVARYSKFTVAELAEKTQIMADVPAYTKVGLRGFREAQAQGDETWTE